MAGGLEVYIVSKHATTVPLFASADQLDVVILIPGCRLRDQTGRSSILNHHDILIYRNVVVQVVSILTKYYLPRAQLHVSKPEAASLRQAAGTFVHH